MTAPEIRLASPRLRDRQDTDGTDAGAAEAAAAGDADRLRGAGAHGPASDPFLALVGRRVRAVRMARSLSRRALSERSGVSPRFIAHLEAGEGNISIVRLKEIADALAVPLSQLVDTGAGRVDAVPAGAAAIGEFAEEDGEAFASGADRVADDVRRLGVLFARASQSQRQRAIDALAAEQHDRASRVALIGLRGAGKSTLGAAAAKAIGVPFVELNREIEDISGLAVAEIFALYGEEGYRALERRALDAVADRHGDVVLAVAGGIVGERATFERLLTRFTAVWLRASPDEHMSRVIAQGDRRPMAGNPAAMDQLKSILRAREAHYARAPLVLDTSSRSFEKCASELAALIAPLQR